MKLLWPWPPGNMKNSGKSRTGITSLILTKKYGASGRVPDGYN